VRTPACCNARRSVSSAAPSAAGPSNTRMAGRASKARAQIQPHRALEQRRRLRNVHDGTAETGQGNRGDIGAVDLIVPLVGRARPTSRWPSVVLPLAGPPRTAVTPGAMGRSGKVTLCRHRSARTSRRTISPRVTTSGCAPGTSRSAARVNRP